MNTCTFSFLVYPVDLHDDQGVNVENTHSATPFASNLDPHQHTNSILSLPATALPHPRSSDSLAFFGHVNMNSHSVNDLEQRYIRINAFIILTRNKKDLTI